MDRSELRRLHDRAVGDGRRYWADSHVQALVQAVGELLAEDDPTVEIAYLRATIGDLETAAAAPAIPGPCTVKFDGGRQAVLDADRRIIGYLTDVIPGQDSEQPQRVQPSREDIAQVFDTHRWKSMGVTSVECECGEILYGDHNLTKFPADDAFRAHLAEGVLAILAAQPTVAEVRAQAIHDAIEVLDSSDPIETALAGIDYPIRILRQLERESEGGAR